MKAIILNGFKTKISNLNYNTFKEIIKTFEKKNKTEKVDLSSKLLSNLEDNFFLKL